MKNLNLFIALFGLLQILNAQNPISPEGVFIADPAGHTWKDGKLYIYGSLDESPNYFCSTNHHVLSTSDLLTWTLHKNVFASKGPNDQVSYNDQILYAPDCHYRDGKYYLYYCQPDTAAEGVAVSESPTGPFVKGERMLLKGKNEIDPGAFTDDDGTSYYVWGQFGMKMAKLKPNMKQIDESSIVENVITEKEHFFHEGAHMVKRNGIYYLIYAHQGRKNMPSCIGYAMSKSPMGPYKYGGVIIDNDGCDPNNWNNHGSIVEFQKKWYVLYHRTTNGAISMRKACIEPITFNSDGTINEVEMTSQGAGAPLSAFQTIEARRAALLFGTSKVIMDYKLNEVVGDISVSDKMVFKYIDFGKGADSLIIKVKLGKLEGGFNIHLDQPWGPWKGYVHFPPATNTDRWETLKTKIQPITGVHAVWFKFYGKNVSEPFFQIDEFVFVPKTK
ncbi:MAG: family 43 glycosylhydrolase [Bacteroidota bacterium]|nr:family 43 glycosylhydrolase [Bacteroidota bacterium]